MCAHATNTATDHLKKRGQLKEMLFYIHLQIFFMLGCFGFVTVVNYGFLPPVWIYLPEE